jgi:FkbM family methyltransferase
MKVSIPYLARNLRLKVRTLSRARERVRNWREVVGLRLKSNCEQVSVLRLRDGTQVACRGGDLDWGAFSNVVLLDECATGLDYLRKLGGSPLVLDLGANIGLFSLLAAQAHSLARVIAYEPAPPNLRIFEINRLLNPALAERIQVVAEAVGGQTRKCEFLYDEQQPEASALGRFKGVPYPVTVRSFAELVGALRQPVALAKIDVEAAEFEILEHTPKAVWERVGAIAIELHSDDLRKTGGFLERMKMHGYEVAPDWEGRAYFLRRRDS